MTTLAISYFLVVSVRYTLLLLLPVNIIGNSFVVIIFFKKKATRQFSDLLLFNLATADLLFGIVVLICSLAFHFAGTTINDFYCKATGGVVYLSCGVSVFTLVAIAMERHGAVVRPMRARVRMRDLTRNRKIVQIIWILALLLVSPIVVFLKKIDVCEDIVDCGFVQNDGMAEFGRIYDAVVVSCAFPCSKLLHVWPVRKVSFQALVRQRRPDSRERRKSSLSTTSQTETGLDEFPP
ncbi:hypothetical protein OS493_025984 [Desmophyllum pertusum]|uniref:G-protein coupled receptors family 1 profile domain-containing protein n=1 Tax=Desmophyllum pertusum TaxID=174260 RepID=A0A9W9YLC0_9CNID|nr:hypothetical protein OS493_025984 [Desmophyllum pertusum]